YGVANLARTLNGALCRVTALSLPLGVVCVGLVCVVWGRAEGIKICTRSADHLTLRQLRSVRPSGFARLLNPTRGYQYLSRTCSPELGEHRLRRQIEFPAERQQLVSLAREPFRRLGRERRPQPRPANGRLLDSSKMALRLLQPMI